MNMLETNEKLESSSKEKFNQRNRKYKEKLNRNFMTKPYNKNSQWMGSTAEWRGQRKRIGELKDKKTGITPSKGNFLIPSNRENGIKKKSRVTGTCGIITKDLTFVSSDSQKGKKKEQD